MGAAIDFRLVRDEYLRPYAIERLIRYRRRSEDGAAENCNAEEAEAIDELLGSAAHADGTPAFAADLARGRFAVSRRFAEAEKQGRVRVRFDRHALELELDDVLVGISRVAGNRHVARTDGFDGRAARAAYRSQRSGFAYPAIFDVDLDAERRELVEELP